MSAYVFNSETIYLKVVDDTELYDLQAQIANGEAFLAHIPRDVDLVALSSSTPAGSPFDPPEEGVVASPVLYRHRLRQQTFSGVGAASITGIYSKCIVVTGLTDVDAKCRVRDCMIRGLLFERALASIPHRIDVSGDALAHAADMAKEAAAELGILPEFSGVFPHSDDALTLDEFQQMVLPIPWIGEATSSFYFEPADIKSHTAAQLARWTNLITIINQLDRAKKRRAINALMRMWLGLFRVLLPGRNFYFPTPLDYLYLPFEVHRDFLWKDWGLQLAVPITYLPDGTTFMRNCGWSIKGDGTRFRDERLPIRYQHLENVTILSNTIARMHRTCNAKLRLDATFVGDLYHNVRELPHGRIWGEKTESMAHEGAAPLTLKEVIVVDIDVTVMNNMNTVLNMIALMQGQSFIFANYNPVTPEGLLDFAFGDAGGLICILYQHGGRYPSGIDKMLAKSQ